VSLLQTQLAYIKHYICITYLPSSFELIKTVMTARPWLSATVLYTQGILLIGVGAVAVGMPSAFVDRALGTVSPRIQDYLLTIIRYLMIKRDSR
jgi:hypothetical protein